ncbi:MAG TPA: DUF2892 domain-containing protein [Telmatospirillum sp.]|nr:DUF2892 domain-containing protein [Telmatospirillum sp.]
MGFYRKNIGGRHQIVRVGIGAAAAVAAMTLLAAPGNVLGAAAGLMVAVSGFIGYCPLFAIVGINLPTT